MALGAAAVSPFGTALSKVAAAADRRVVGGKISLRLPFLLGSVDPHRLDDLAAQILSPALFDTLYTVRGDGHFVVPGLAAGPPVDIGSHFEIPLRSGLVSSYGKKLTSQDVVFSIERARSTSGTSWLASVGSVSAKDARTVQFEKNARSGGLSQDATILPRLLSSPLYAIVPSSFSPTPPDGTGPFRAEPTKDGIRLVRNSNAPLGAAVLDEILITSAPDLAASLRAFESGTDDLSFLGLGLYGKRAGATRFDGGPLGDVVLVSGAKASIWDVPGVLQEVALGLDRSSLRPILVDDTFVQTGPEIRWGKGPIDLMTRRDPWLMEIARAVAASLSKPGSPVNVAPWDDAERRARYKDRAFAFAIELVRPFHETALLAGARTHAIISAFAPQRARELPEPTARTGDVRSFFRTHRLGVIAEAKMQGGVAPSVFVPQPSALPPNGVAWGLIAREAK